MAPALVEHLAAARERNSTSKDYSNFGTYLSKLDLFDKFGHPYFEIKPVSSLKNSSYLEMNNSDKNNRQNTRFAENKDMVPLKDIHILPTVTELKGIVCEERVGYKNGTLNYKLDNLPLTDVPPIYSMNTTKYDCNTTIVRSPQPVAVAPALCNPDISNYLHRKNESCGLKFFDLNKSVNKLNLRLRTLQSKNVSSHVASHITKQDDVHENSKSHKSTSAKHKNEIPSGSCSQTAWEDLRKVHAMVGFGMDSTDGEDELEIRHKAYVKCKKKCDNPPPTPEELHQWKVKRAHIGSQCSWLNLKISNLDNKISQLDQLYRKHKSQRKQLVKTVTSSNHSTHTKQTTLDTSEIVLTSNQPSNRVQPIETQPLVDEQISQRVLPYTSTRQHKYVVSPQRTNIEKYDSCRCLPSISSCRLCQHLQRHLLSDLRNVRIGKLDHSYHPILSFENDVSLSFLLEETLRKQRINTKVTISKPTKKKKKLRIKERGDNTLSTKDPPGHRRSLSSEKDLVKSKGDRLKYDDLSRKRSTGLDPPVHTGGRTRKIRKLSESEESWKPSTPTSELNSPFSQSLPTSAFFPLKNRKRSGGSEYDINNIVIPYSMAAATRVERIQYKEIPTPGWRSANSTYNGHSDTEEEELTDDEFYLERHGRCELNERKKFTDYFRPVIRRQRPYHLSESTASGPPSPLVNDDFRPTINTPIDSSPVINTSTNNRVVNVVVVPPEERGSCWTSRTYPLNASECHSLSDSITTAVLSTSLHSNTKSSFPEFTTTDSTKYLLNSPAATVPESPLETPIPTPIHTPLETPLCSPVTLSSDGGDSGNPANWTVKVLNETPLDVVTTESQRTGIVLKLAKK